MNIYDAQSYRFFFNEVLQEQAWGAVKKFAEILKCHSTYVSQVAKGKADLSTEQAIAFCQHLELDSDATEHFLDLLQEEKAGNSETRTFFRQKIIRRMEARMNIKRRLQISENMNNEQESIYYSGWLPQVVHMACQLPGEGSAAAIAKIIKAEPDTVEAILQDLNKIGVIKYSKGKIDILREFVHLGEESSNINRFHVNWRMKTAAEISASTRLPGIHYSSVASMSAETEKEIKELILRHVQDTRKLIAPSPSEALYAYCLDFYQLTHLPPKARR